MCFYGVIISDVAATSHEQVSVIADEPTRCAVSQQMWLQTKVDAQCDKLAIELS